MLRCIGPRNGSCLRHSQSRARLREQAQRTEPIANASAQLRADLENRVAEPSTSATYQEAAQEPPDQRSPKQPGWYQVYGNQSKFGDDENPNCSLFEDSYPWKVENGEGIVDQIHRSQSSGSACADNARAQREINAQMNSSAGIMANQVPSEDGMGNEDEERVFMGYTAHQLERQLEDERVAA